MECQPWADHHSLCLWYSHTVMCLTSPSISRLWNRSLYTLDRQSGRTEDMIRNRIKIDQQMTSRINVLKGKTKIENKKESKLYVKHLTTLHGSTASTSSGSRCHGSDKVAKTQQKAAIRSDGIYCPDVYRSHSFHTMNSRCQCRKNSDPVTNH